MAHGTGAATVCGVFRLSARAAGELPFDGWDPLLLVARAMLRVLLQDRVR